MTLSPEQVVLEMFPKKKAPIHSSKRQLYLLYVILVDQAIRFPLLCSHEARNWNVLAIVMVVSGSFTSLCIIHWNINKRLFLF
jgi:hypothetical protein